MDVILEKTDVWYRAPLKDKDDVLLNYDGIATMTMTLYDKKTSEESGGGIINLRDAYDVRNSGAWDKGVTVTESESMNLVVRLTPADNIIVNTDDIDIGGTEVHILLLEGTTAGIPSFTFKHEVEIKVKNLNKVS